MSEMIYGIHAVQALLERAPERFQDALWSWRAGPARRAW